MRSGIRIYVAAVGWTPPPTTPPPVGAASSARERELSSPPTARRLHSDRRRRGRGGGEGILTAGALTAATLQNPPGRREGIGSDSVRARATATATAIVGPRSRGGARCGVTRRGGRRRRSGGAGSCRRRRRRRPPLPRPAPRCPAPASSTSAAPTSSTTHGSTRYPISRSACLALARWGSHDFVSGTPQDTAFPMTERDRLGLRGLLPPRVMSFEQQYDRFSESTPSTSPNFRPRDHLISAALSNVACDALAACCVAVNSFRSLEHNTRGEPDTIVALAKWRILNRLHDRNETLYYRVSALSRCCSGDG